MRTRIILNFLLCLVLAMPARAQEMSANVKEEKEFLAANKNAKGVKTLSSGLQYKIVKKGKGKRPTMKDEVYVKYTGYFVDGTIFDLSTRKPAAFPMNGVIKGMSEGLGLIGEGGQITLYIPSALAYGSVGNDAIEPDKMLIFDIELVEVYNEEE